MTYSAAATGPNFVRPPSSLFSRRRRRADLARRAGSRLVVRTVDAAVQLSRRRQELDGRQVPRKQGAHLFLFSLVPERVVRRKEGGRREYAVGVDLLKLHFPQIMLGLASYGYAWKVRPTLSFFLRFAI